MDVEKLRQLLDAVRQGNATVEDALGRLRQLPFEDLGYARLDLHRALRNAMPEVVLCEGKTIQQAIAILKRLWQHHDRILGTRVSPDMAESILKEIPTARYEPISRLVVLAKGVAPSPPDGAPYVLIVTGGTADLPVAEEAAQTLEFLGSCVQRAYDVGVAGIHRLFDQLEIIQQATVVISVAGMEGALTSVVGGLVSCPVVGVPTSVGYGASFNGLAALLSMLNSCAAGVSVVNIDNGFGAAVVAHRILQAHTPAGQAKEQV
jgi:pyridinium-3,5-biscarboxylic acid mononucleotide synthase